MTPCVPPEERTAIGPLLPPGSGTAKAENKHVHRPPVEIRKFQPAQEEK
jgi:hypothetical protein